jgi:hypothetical protein
MECQKNWMISAVKAQKSIVFYLSHEYMNMLLYMPTCKQLFQFQNVGTLDEHMYLLLPALIRLFKVDASVDIRRAAIKTLTKLIPGVQVVICTPVFFFSFLFCFVLFLFLFLFLFGSNSILAVA